MYAGFGLSKRRRSDNHSLKIITAELWICSVRPGRLAQRTFTHNVLDINDKHLVSRSAQRGRSRYGT